MAEVKVDIYGAGCDKFFQTVNSFKRASRECKVVCRVSEITDGRKIAAHGLVNLPAVFIDEKLISQGEGVDVERAEELLRMAV